MNAFLSSQSQQYKHYEYDEIFFSSALFHFSSFLFRVVLRLIGVIKHWIERRSVEKWQIFRSHLPKIQLDINLFTYIFIYF